MEKYTTSNLGPPKKVDGVSDRPRRVFKVVRKASPETHAESAFRARKDPAWAAKIKFARTLRKNPTECERIVRDELRSRGRTFDFQVIRLGYIPDFLFASQKAVIEIDGGIYTTPEQREYDRLRDSHFRAAGYRVLRITDRQVRTNLDAAVNLIEAFVHAGGGLSKKEKKRIVRAKRRQRRRATENGVPPIIRV